MWLTREPGGTPLGERLRELLLHEPMEPLTERCSCSRRAANIASARSGRGCTWATWVVSDRFTDATYAYQGGGHGLPAEQIATLERFALGAFQPDLTLIFDVPVDVGRARLAAGRTLDKFERQQVEFFERVRAAYLARASAEPQRCRVIDSTLPQSIVRDQLAAVVGTL